MTHRAPETHTGDHDALAVGWALHTLDPDEATAFEAHLETCPTCRRTVDDTTAILGDLGGAVVPSDPPPRLRQRLLDAVDADLAAGSGPGVDTPDAPSPGPVPSPEEPSPERRDATVVPLAPRRRATRWLAAAAVVLVVAAIGGLTAANQSLRDERDSAQAAAAAQAEREAAVADVLRDAGSPGVSHAVLAGAQGGIVGLVVDDGTGQRVLTTGLGPNDAASEIYVLWGLVDGTPQALGTFDVGGRAPDVRSVPSSPEAVPYAGFAVSLEPGRTAPASPTRVVASGQVGR
ncbi:anti-sigma factor domain-containing protein [Actinomycetospora rhizophila]|uniref:Regulator of SigK n=1 Tax=Actinomycetospora rhizophila TaxID=1416876 RepID=A0ABV9ZGK1_9PSEU